MRIGTEDNFVELLCQMVEPSDSPAGGDICVAVVVRNQGFSAELDGIWIVARDFDNFLVQLRRLEETRQGEALVQDAAEREFALKIGTIDRAGHILVSGSLVRWWNIDKPLPPQRLEFSFFLDSEFVKTVLHEAANFRTSST